MGNRGTKAKIRRMSIAEKMAKLSETDMPQVKGRIEQAVLEEQQTLDSKPPDGADSEMNGQPS